MARADLAAALAIPNPVAEASIQFGPASPEIDLGLMEDMTGLLLLSARQNISRARLEARASTRLQLTRLEAEKYSQHQELVLALGLSGRSHHVEVAQELSGKLPEVPGQPQTLLKQALRQSLHLRALEYEYEAEARAANYATARGQLEFWSYSLSKQTSWPLSSGELMPFGTSGMSTLGWSSC